MSWISIGDIGVARYQRAVKRSIPFRWRLSIPLANTDLSCRGDVKELAFHRYADDRKGEVLPDAIRWALARRGPKSVEHESNGYSEVRFAILYVTPPQT